MSTPLLELRGVTKRFGTHAALDDVSLHVDAHEVIGLVGENGAGKSTLLKLLAGVHRPDGGQILLGGRPVVLGNPARAAAEGIGVVHQEQSLLPNLRVAENLLLGHEGDAVRGGFVRRRRLERRAAELLATVKSPVKPSAVTGDLTFAQRQMVEIARAVSQRSGDRPPLVVLDEPTSVLEAADIAILREQVMALRELGSVIFVSHRLDEILDFSDRVYVLRDGKLVGERAADSGTEDDLYRMMIGRSTAAEFYDEKRQRPVASDAREVLTVKGLSSRHTLHDVSLTVHEGEIVALVGVVGSGREELARAVFGVQDITAGEIHLSGSPFRANGPGAAIRAGVAYVPAERRTEGMVGGATVAENIALVHPEVAAVGPIASTARRRTVAQTWIERLSIRPSDPDTDMARLSGGNQQKAVLAKWLVSDSLRLLVLDHPTRGLDVGAKEDLYKLFRDLCEKGIALLVLADTLDEAIGLAHRVVVMRDGQVTATFDQSAESRVDQISLLEKMM